MSNEALKAALEADPSLRIAILFGSMARDSAGSGSDVDLAVAADCPLDSQAKMALIETVSSLTGRPVDIVDLRSIGEPLLGQVLCKGQRLLVRDKGLLAGLMKRHLFDSADFLPYRQRMLAERRQAWIGQ